MKRIGLAALAALFALACPLTASAAPKEAPKAAAKPYEKEQLAKGAKEAPAVLARAGLRCTPTATAWAGLATSKDPATKKDVKQNAYEVACQEGLGYLLVDTIGGDLKSFDCILLSTSAGARCNLPANQDAKTQLTPLVAAAGRTCTVTDARAVGSTPSGDAYFEVGCQGAEGFILKTSKAEPKPEVTDCAVTVGNAQLECKFTTKEQIEASRQAKLKTLLAKSGRACTVSGTRTVGRLKSGDDLYEVACGSAGGFMLQASADGAKVTAVDCGKADQLYQGGCELTNAAEAQSKEAAIYARFAKAAGFPCEVNKYRLIGMDQTGKSELVEIACANRPDGAMGLFPADNSRGTIYDCVAGERFGQKCRLTSASLAYARYTQHLADKGKTTCKVSSTRYVGQTKEGSDFIETGCADGAPGWVLEMANNSVKSLITCGQAKTSGLPCQLPGNTK